jgi:hypothetical protein
VHTRSIAITYHAHELLACFFFLIESFELGKSRQNLGARFLQQVPAGSHNMKKKIINFLFKKNHVYSIAKFG